MKTSAKALLLLCSVMVLMFASCRKDEADASDLLKTVPSDASAVVVVNVEKLLSDAGCKTDGSRIIAGDDVKAALQRASASDRREIEAIFSGQSGIEPTVAVIFLEGGYTYLAGTLASPDDFKAYFEKENQGKFAAEDGVDVLKNVAVQGNRFWVNLAGGSIDSRNVKSFLDLSEKQSALGQPYAKELMEIEDDMRGWGNISSLLNASGLPFQQRAVAKTSMETIFEDPSDLLFSLDFDKGEIEAKVTLLNGKGKPAKVAFPTDKLDLSTIESLDCDAEILVAAAIPRKAIRQIGKSVDSQGASVLGIYLKMLDSIDGTMAVATDSRRSAMEGVVSVTGNSTDLADFLSKTLNLSVRHEGNTLRFNSGKTAGTPVKTLATPLKGAMCGGSMAGYENAPRGMKSLSFGLYPEDGSLQLRIEAVTDTPGENALLTILKNQK